MQIKPPRADEFEISVFGPGRGECIVLHLGDNEWCIVDSCIAKGRNEPVAVEYLQGFNNNALQKVRLVLATHWHDDHIGGLARLLSLTPNAGFCCSMAMQKREFLELIYLGSQNLTGGSGVDEFSALLDILEKRGVRSPVLAVENKALNIAMNPGRPFPIALETLSPSDPSIRIALSEIAKWIPKAGEPQRRIVDRSPNHASVVLWVKAGQFRALLGADLQQTGKADEGWSAVVSCHKDASLAQFFKVPHHGSENADHEDVWHKMLEKEPLAVVTPFTGGNVRIPKASDLDRLSKRTSNLYCTLASTGKPPTRDRLVEREMKRLSQRRVISGQPGHVRVRWRIHGHNQSPPTVETFYGAYQVPNGSGLNR